MTNFVKGDTHPHPFGSFYAPTQAVNVETDTGFARIVNANFVAFLLRDGHGGARAANSKRERRS